MPRYGIAGVLSLVLLALAAGRPASAQEGEAVFVEKLGSDTTAIERVSWRGRTLTGTAVLTDPVTHYVRYEGTFDERGMPTRFVVELERAPGGAEPPQPRRAVYDYQGDSVVVSTSGEQDRTVSVATPVLTLPMLHLPATYGLFEYASRLARRRGTDSLPFLALPPGAQQAFPNAVVRTGPRSVTMDDFGNPVHARVDEDGGLLTVDGSETTHKVSTRRTSAAVDLTGYARRYAARDQRGTGIGVPSPTDSARAALAGGSVRVVYGRPAARGRTVWGQLVPFGEVWRTGANAATHLTTDVALELGGHELPAGSYTLWTIPTADGMELILNSQTRIWGTMHDPEHDLFDVPMRLERLEEPVERFTIRIEPRDGGDRATLVLEWADRRHSVALRPAAER